MMNNTSQVTSAHTKNNIDQNEWIICHKDDVEKNDWYNIFYNEDSTDDESSQDDLVNKAFNAYDKEFQEKAQQYMDEGLPEKQASKKSGRDLRSEYRRALMKNYKYVIVTMHNLRGNSMHHNVLKETNKLMEENGYEFEKAFRMSMKRHQIAF